MDVVRYALSELDPAQWDAFIDRAEPAVPFLYHGYLGAVAPDTHLLVATENDRWLAALPVRNQRKYGLAYSYQPPFSPFWGPVFAGLPDNPHRRLSAVLKQTEALLAALPKLARFRHTLAPTASPAFAWHWAGYRLETRYTYVVLAEAALAEIYGRRLREQLRKTARDGFVCRQATPEEFPLFLALTTKQQAVKEIYTQPHTLATLQRLLPVAATAPWGRMWLCLDPQGEPAAAGWAVWHPGGVFYVANTVDPAARKSGAVAVLTDALLRAALEENLSFNFSGSMLPAVEHFFRGFGGTAVPYVYATRDHLPLLKWLRP